MNPTALADCPHCGSTDRSGAVFVWIFEMGAGRTQTMHQVFCGVGRGGCGCSGPPRPNVIDAVEAWNRRTPHPDGCCCAPCRAKVM